MLSCESYASILRLDAKKTEKIVIAFVGVRISIATSTELYKKYHAMQACMGPEDLSKTNSNMYSTFVFTNFSFQQPETLTDLWRVAKEGAHVYVLQGMRGGIIEPSAEIKNFRDYGLEYYGPGIHSCWPYSRGIVRKDVAKHFRN